jgi:hypothetical protein
MEIIFANFPIGLPTNSCPLTKATTCLWVQLMTVYTLTRTIPQSLICFTAPSCHKNQEPTDMVLFTPELWYLVNKGKTQPPNWCHLESFLMLLFRLLPVKAFFILNSFDFGICAWNPYPYQAPSSIYTVLFTPELWYLVNKGKTQPPNWCHLESFLMLGSQPCKTHDGIYLDQNNTSVTHLLHSSKLP